MTEIRRLSSEVKYANRWLRVREDAIRRADGSDGIYGVVEKPDYALIIPVDADAGLWVVEQFRYPVGGRYVEFPQGSWDAEPAADRATLAAGELAEETGLRAGRLEHLGHLFGAYGFSDQGFDVWRATDLTPGPPRLDPEEQGLVSFKVSPQEFDALIDAGRFKDAASLAAWALHLRHPLA